MKKLLLSITAITFSAMLFAQKTVADVAKFDTETINQGNLKINEAKEVRFTVTNISKEPLIIEEAKPGCGCTLGDYSKAPIAPGATGFISAKFNAATVGHFDKHISVKFSGVDELKSISITGDVLSVEDYDKWAKTEADAAAAAAAAAKNTKGSKNKTGSKNN